MVNNLNISDFDGIPPPAGDDRRIGGGPIYPIERILSYTDESTARAWTKKAVKDLQQLRWDISDVLDLLKLLSTAKYYGSEWCENGRGIWAACDSYFFKRAEYIEAAHKYLEIEYFLKFGIQKNNNQLLIVSCHPPKY